jgi:hypothetical protein
MQAGEKVAQPSTPGPATESSAKNKKRVKIRISLFFDGTYNNRSNSMARIDNTADYRRGDASFENDLSNVARLEEQVRRRAAEPYHHYKSIYVEGIGTTNLATVSLVGGAVGGGATGIVAKVNKGISAAIGELYELGLEPSETIIEKLSFDTCGFSRGAAAARYCVHRILKGEGRVPNLQTLLGLRGWEVEQVEVLAVGLFDTVSSYGISHSDDRSELKLGAIRDAAAVLQLAAAEEYRTNFSLTNINSAGGKGRQVYLPGAHTDVGGGYVDGAPEIERLVRGPESRDIAAFLLERGWYRNEGKSKQLVHSTSGTGSVSVNRASISQNYSFIPLHIMADFLTDHGVSFLPELKGKYDPRHVPALEAIEKYARSEGNSKPSDWEDAKDEKLKEELKQLRNEYLHTSFSTTVGMGARVINQGTWRRPRYRPYRLVYHDA